MQFCSYNSKSVYLYCLYENIGLKKTIENELSFCLKCSILISNFNEMYYKCFIYIVINASIPFYNKLCLIKNMKITHLPLISIFCSNLNLHQVTHNIFLYIFFRFKSIRILLSKILPFFVQAHSRNPQNSGTGLFSFLPFYSVLLCISFILQA